MERYFGLTFRQGDDKHRLTYPPQYPFGHAAEEGVADDSLSMGAHDDNVAAKLIGFLEYHLGRVPLNNLDRLHSIDAFRSVLEFFFAKGPQPLGDTVLRVNPLFFKKLLSLIFIN